MYQNINDDDYFFAGLYPSEALLRATGFLTATISWVDRLCYLLYCLAMWVLPWHPQSDLLELCATASAVTTCTDSSLTKVASRKAVARQKLFDRKWVTFTENVCSQWQMVNYVSAVLIG